MLNLETFSINGKSSSDFGCYVVNSNWWDKPSRNFSTQKVVGRNGALHTDEGTFEDIELTFDVFSGEEFEGSYNSLMDWVLSKAGYVRIDTSFDPDHFILAYVSEGSEPDFTTLRNMGTATVTFTRKPQRFLVSGDSFVEYASGSTISNPYPVTAKPIIRCYGSGAVQIGDYSFEIKGNPYEYLDVDSELQDCYHLTDNGNNCLTCEEFPLLEGDSALTWSGFDKIEIKSRLWQL